jgi:Tfp pilus assembly protein PilO
MSTQNKLYITIGATGALLLVWIYFLVIPMIADISENRNTLESLNMQMNTTSLTQSKINTLKAQVSQLEMDITSIENKCIPLSTLDHLINHLRTRFSERQIRLISLTPMMSYLREINQSDNSQFCHRLPLDIIVEAQFMDFAGFIDNLDKLPFFLHPEGISVRKQAPGNDRLMIEIQAAVYVTKVSS